MDKEKFGEIVGTSVANGTQAKPEALLEVFTVDELQQELYKRGMAVGSVAVDSAYETLITLESDPTPEALTLTPESLLEGFDQAYSSYLFELDATNAARSEAKGRKKPAQLETVDADVIRTDVEAILANEGVMAELQAEVDYFTHNPEDESPEAAFDLMIVPEGLNLADELAIAADLQGKIPSHFVDPYIRPEAYNDKRTPVVTGKGYRLSFAPRHYNVPKGTAKKQTTWLNGNNHRTTATELQTATDAEAMAYINGLANTGAFDNPTTRFDQTYFRRFDQAPCGGRVSRVNVSDFSGLFLGESYANYVYPTRALVVPKA
ncbi:MAG: hypothetical protein M3P98_02565 [bacterium]|nr:hypothetical protein [bacterium]